LLSRTIPGTGGPEALPYQARAPSMATSLAAVSVCTFWIARRPGRPREHRHWQTV